MTIPAGFQAFAASLGRLAAPASEQINYLTSLGVADLTDELALEFDDLYRPIAEALDHLSPESASACRQLDQILSSDELGWSFADLESAEWERVRASAAAAAAALSKDSADGSQ